MNKIVQMSSIALMINVLGFIYRCSMFFYVFLYFFRFLNTFIFPNVQKIERSILNVMKKRLRDFILVLMSLCIIGTSNLCMSSTVYAGSMGSEINSIGGWDYADEELSCTENTVALLIAALRVDGYTDEAIAGILSNIQYESGFDPFLVTSGLKKRWEAYNVWLDGESTYSYPNYKVNGGIGLVQWTYGRHAAFSEYSKNHAESLTINNRWQLSPGADYQTVSCCGSVSTQISFLLQENAWIDNDSIVGANVADREAYKSMTDAALAAKIWLLCFEVPSGDLSKVASRRAKSAPKWLNLIQHNYSLAEYVDKEQAASLALFLSSEGHWSQDQLTAYQEMVGLSPVIS